MTRCPTPPTAGKNPHGMDAAPFRRRSPRLAGIAVFLLGVGLTGIGGVPGPTRAGQPPTASAPTVTSPTVTPPPGFVPLFNGRDLNGWHGWAIHSKGGTPADIAQLSPEQRQERFARWTEDARRHWRVENGELVNDGQGAYLATDREFGDIELLIEYKTVPGADSGIYLRNTPQVQIWDWNQPYNPKNPHRKPHLGSGGLFNNAPGSPGRDPLVRADKPFGEWNRFRILQIGERTTVYLNDKLVVDGARMENYWDRRRPLPKRGKILLQTHGGEIRWRNIFVREIPPQEANAWLAKHHDAGFVPVFNGKDLSGWKGALDSCEVADGAIVWKKGKGGVLFTEKEYGDHVVRLEYRVPPGGNNGLAIRYPGKGRASTDGMCEIQILDDDHPRYARLDPRQFNGSAYGMIAAHRGYTRPAGEWNFMEISVRGSHIQVELNGTRILDGNLATVTEFKDNQPHPGKDRSRGHFGFAGHGDPVTFRNIMIRELEP